jgi:hypothetical protein
MSSVSGIWQELKDLLPEEETMNVTIRGASILCCLPLLLLGPAALGGLNGVDVKITNDGTEDIVVTVYDASTQPNSVVLSHERINGFTSVPVSLVADAAGRANLSWTAVTADPNARKCGHESKLGLIDAASVSVHADSSCTGT